MTMTNWSIKVQETEKEVSDMAEKTITTPQESSAPKREETRSQEQYIRPAVDIMESAEGLTLIVDLPGVPRENLTITIENGVLTIEGVPEAGVPHGLDVYREFGLSRLYRQFQIPDEIDPEKADAALVSGVLTLRLFKAEAAKPRKISIQAA
jgi:HSP20 family protein